jgi:serine/threonine-protein kinase
VRIDDGNTLTSTEDESALGRVVNGRYELLRAIADGGTSRVFEARDQESRRRVALKLLSPEVAEDEASRVRFEREASAPGAIGHPAIVQVFDTGVDETDGSPFVVMELLEGQTLRQRLQGEALSEGRALEIALAALEGLAVAHEKGFVHRDLKPENIFLQDRGDQGPEVRLLDFGLARHVMAKVVTTANATVGTPQYMSPEQISRPTSADPSIDVWATGVLLYEMLGGRRPFDGKSEAEVLIGVVKEPHQPLLELAPETPTGVAKLVEACLRKHAGDRPVDAGAVLGRLRRALDPGTAAAPPLEQASVAAQAAAPQGDAAAGARPGPTGGTARTAAALVLVLVLAASLFALLRST